MEFLALKLLLALGIGGLIGLEREAHDSPFKKTGDESSPHSAGIRSFALISTMGMLAGLLINSHFPFFLIISGAFFMLILLYYVLQSTFSKDNGFTTELSLFFTYIIGVILAINLIPLQVLFAVVVMLITVLSRKQDIQKFLYKVSREEINAFSSFALVTLVILPFLPNAALSISDAPALQKFIQTYGVQLGDLAKIELFNPYKFWLIIVLITGIDMAGYLLSRIVGPNRGIVLASLVGGLVSSTAATQALANKSKSDKNSNRYVGAAILTTAVSFFPIFLLIASVNASFLITLTPTLLSLIITGFIVGGYFIFSDKKSGIKGKKQNLKAKSESDIFSIGPALKFGILFIIVRIVTQISLLLFGETGFLVSSALAGLTGIDAATLNISELVGESIEVKLAILAFILVNTVNLGAKVFYSYVQGAHAFALKLGIGMGIIALASLIGLLF